MTISVTGIVYSSSSTLLARFQLTIATSSTATLATTANGGFSTPINLSATGNPVGTSVSFSTSPLTPGSTTSVTLNNTNTLSPGTYNVTVTGVAGAVTQTTTIAFVVSPGTPPAISAQPVDVALCAGNPTSFSVVTAASGVSYQWQQSANGGITWTDITGANTATYSIASVTNTMNNLKFRAQLSTQCANTTSSIATLTVNVATAITSQPTNVTICANNAVTFTASATGAGVTYQWEQSTDGGTTWTAISGATNATLTLAASAVTTSISNSKYRMIATVTTGACPGSLNTDEALLIVNAVPVVTATAPQTTVCSGTSIILTAGGADTYSWTPGGQSSATLNITPTVTTANPGLPNPVTYTVTGTTTAGCVNTQSITITANPLPVVNITGSLPFTSMIPGAYYVMTANVTPISPLTNYQWYVNGTAIPGATSQTYTGDVDHLGTYHCDVTINGSCGNTSNAITLIDSVAKQMFIYPNPSSDGNFTIRYNSKIMGLGNPVNCIIYDLSGKRIFQKSFTPMTPYDKMQINMNPYARGTYFIDLMDGSGQRLDSEKIIIKP